MASDPVARAISEAGARARQLLARFRQNLQTGLEGETSERNQDRVIRKERELAGEVLPTVVELPWRGPVARGRAPASGRNQRPREPETVSGADRLGTVGEARGVEGAEEEVARLVSGEDSPGAVASVRRRSQAHQKNPRARISEGGERSRPIFLPDKTAGRMFRRLFAPRHEARATAAGDDFTLDRGECLNGLGFAVLGRGFCDRSLQSKHQGRRVQLFFHRLRL